jgi:hypothetical protein
MMMIAYAIFAWCNVTTRRYLKFAGGKGGSSGTMGDPSRGLWLNQARLAYRVTVRGCRASDPAEIQAPARGTAGAAGSGTPYLAPYSHKSQ